MFQLGKFTRNIPAGGTEDIGGLLLPADPIEGWTNVKRETVALYGGVTVPQKIARQTSTVQDFPDDGTGTCQAGSTSSTIKLAANALQSYGAGLTTTSLLVAIVAGTGANQVRRITSEPSSAVCNVTPNWSVTPAAGDTYRLLVSLAWLNRLFISAEYSVSGSTATILPVYYGWPLDGAGNAAKPFVTRDNNTLQLTNHAYQPAANEITETSFYAGGLVAIDSRGLLGVKIRLMSIDAGTVSLWATGS